MSKGYRRKQFFFKESSQGKYIFSYFIIAGLAAVIFTFLFVYFSADTLTIKYDNSELQLGNTPEIMIDRLLGIHGILIFLGGLSIIYFGTRFTHRTVGPLFKIGKTIDKMINGDMTKHIYLRKKDECKEIAEKLNTFNTLMHSRLIEIDSLTNAMNDLIENQVTDSSSEDVKEMSMEEIHELHVLCGKLKVILSGFNLSRSLPRD